MAGVAERDVSLSRKSDFQMVIHVSVIELHHGVLTPNTGPAQLHTGSMPLRSITSTRLKMLLVKYHSYFIIFITGRTVRR